MGGAVNGVACGPPRTDRPDRARLPRADDFHAFMEDRQARLLRLIEQATGQAAYRGDEIEEAGVEKDSETAEAELTMAA